MDTIEKTYLNCRNYDTFKCLLRKYHDLMSQIKLFWIILPGSIITADKYLEFKEKCDKVCADCDKFERKETD